jgi:excinuclease ABC subunit C
MIMNQINLQEKLQNLPDKPGVYMMKDEHGKVIYVGKASSLRNRVRSYFQKGQTLDSKTQVLVSKIKDIDWLVTTSDVEALMLECNLIKQYRPRYNVRLRDDKHYPYICVTTSDVFPRVVVVRRVKEDGNRYFGPYADSGAVKQSLRLIRRIFRIRSCNKKLTGNEQDRPCLNFHIGQCESPCSGRISAIEYANLVKDTCLFLEGKTDSIIDRLNQQMLEAAESLEFERAARLRDQIFALKRVSEHQYAIRAKLSNEDVIAVSVYNGSACVQILFVRDGKIVGRENFFMDGVEGESPNRVLTEFVKQYYRDAAYVPPEILVSHEIEEANLVGKWLSLSRGTKVKLVHPKRGEKRQLIEIAIENASLAVHQEYEASSKDSEKALSALQALADVLGMQSVPHRIEAYDISNIQGRDAVGSMVVFENGLPAKDQYRRFKIRAPQQPDDYTMIREVINRRMSHTDDPKFASLPDLIVVDGGKGQLNAALEVLTQLGDDLGSKIRVISLAKRFEEVYLPNRDEPITLPFNSEALHILQRIRDEAHRFALTYHQNIRARNLKSSILDSIPGVGSARRKALIRRFGSVAGIKKASLEDLLTVPGITRPVAEAIKEALGDDSGNDAHGAS